MKEELDFFDMKGGGWAVPDASCALRRRPARGTWPIAGASHASLKHMEQCMRINIGGTWDEEGLGEIG